MVRILAIFGLLCCCAALPGWAQGGGPLAEGDRLLEARDYAKALQAYLAAWMGAPDNPAPIARIGDLFMATGKPIDATRFYAAAIKLNPGYEDAVAGLAYAYVQANRPDQTLALLEDPVRIRAFAKSWRAQHALGLAYTKLNRPADAIGPLRVAAGIMPDVAYLHGDLGNALYLAKDDTAALTAYDTALRLDPTDAQANLNRSCALERLARYAEAATALAAYLELTNPDPDDPQRRRLDALQAKAGVAA